MLPPAAQIFNEENAAVLLRLKSQCEALEAPGGAVIAASLRTSPHTAFTAFTITYFSAVRDFYSNY